MSAILDGLRIVEGSAFVAAPLGGMTLAQLGADVIRFDNIGGGLDYGRWPLSPDGGRSLFWSGLNKGKRSIAIDVKSPEGREIALKLTGDADVLLEQYRPGVMERLGLGPGECMAQNERLVYGRMTGWGQDGPLAGRAGHDTNYIAMAGALHGIGEAGRPGGGDTRGGRNHRSRRRLDRPTLLFRRRVRGRRPLHELVRCRHPGISQQEPRLGAQVGRHTESLPGGPTE